MVALPASHKDTSRITPIEPAVEKFNGSIY